MNKQTVLKTIRSYEKTFLTESEHIKGEFSHSHLRLWRISLKQYKTLSYFVFGKKNVNKELKTLYTIAGETRKRWVNYKKSKKLLTGFSTKELVSFQKFCLKKSERSKKVFLDTLSFYTPDKGLFNDIKEFISVIPTSDIELLYTTFKSKVVQSIQTILEQQTISDDDLHDIRKETKHLLYFAELLNDGSMQEYKTISKYLGRWNDSIELLFSVIQRSKKNSNKKNKKHIKKFKTTTKIQKKEILSYLSTHFTR